MAGPLLLILIAFWVGYLGPLWVRNAQHKDLEVQISQAEEREVRWWHEPVGLSQRELMHLRRQRTLMGLLTLELGAVLMSASNHLSWYSVILPTIMLVAFLYKAMQVTAPQRRAEKARTAVAQQVEQPAVSPLVLAAQSVVDVAPTVALKLTEAVRRTWTPAPTPIPTYLLADRATPTPRKFEVDRPWTGEEMVKRAEELRAAREASMREVQERLEKARALAQERARLAALARDQRLRDIG